MSIVNNFQCCMLANECPSMQEDECLMRSKRSLGEKVIHRDQRDMAGKVNRLYLISSTVHMSHLSHVTLTHLISCSKQINSWTEMASV